MVKLSGLVCAHDEEDRLAACLERLWFCDQVVVVADRCTDRTEEIAGQYGATVVAGAFPLEGLRKHAGLAACTGQWVFEVDCDERVSTPLGHEVRAVLLGEPAGDWFQVPVDNYVGERLVRHGWGGSFGTSLVVRLYRREAKRWKSDRVHPGVTMDGTLAGRLTGTIAHLVDDDIGDMFARLNRYTGLKAQDLADKTLRGDGRLRSLGSDVFRGFRRFFKCYVSRKGYREGEYGFLIALMAALYPVMSTLRAREILATRRDAAAPVLLHPLPLLPALPQPMPARRAA